MQMVGDIWKTFEPSFFFSWPSLFTAVSLLALLVFKGQSLLKNGNIKLCLKTFIGLCLNIIILPFVVILYMFFWLYHNIIFYLICKTNDGNFSKLEGLDGVWRNECENSKAHMHGAFIFKGQPDLIKLKAHVNNRFVSKKDAFGNIMYPKAKKILIEKYGCSFWQEDPDFDINNHLSEVNLLELYSHEKDLTSEERITKYICETHQDPIADGRGQLWEIKILITNKDEYIQIFKVHHMFTDGIAFIRFMFEIYSDEPVKYKKLVFKYSTWQRIIQNFLSVCHFPFALLVLFTKLDRRYKNALHTGKKFTGKKRCFALDVPLKKLKAIRKKSKATTHTILLSSISSAVTKYIKKHSQYNEEMNIIIASGIHDYEAPFRVLNTLSFFIKQIPLHIPRIENSQQKELDRLRIISETIEEQKNDSTDNAISDLNAALCNILPRTLYNILFNMSGITTIVTNMPGAMEKATVLGDPMIKMEAWPQNVSPSEMTISFINYCDNVSVSLILEDFPNRDKFDGKMILEDIVSEIDNLAKTLKVEL